MEARCRKAAADGHARGFDVQMPETGRCYHLRLVPGPDGVTLYFTDVTEKRRHEAERSRVRARPPAERAARIAELTAALAKATTSRDVVDAVAQRVLPPFARHRAARAGRRGRPAAQRRSGRLPATLPRHASTAVHGRRGRPRLGRDLHVRAPLFLSSRRGVRGALPRHGRPARSDVGKQAWAFLPLTASGHTFGVCVDRLRPRRAASTDEERTLLTAISALVAQALERARLYDAEHTRSRELQRALLPRTLPDLPGVHGRRPLPARRAGHGRRRRLVRRHPALRRPGRARRRRRDGPRPLRGGHDGPAAHGRSHPRRPRTAARRDHEPPQRHRQRPRARTRTPRACTRCTTPPPGCAPSPAPATHHRPWSTPTAPCTSRIRSRIRLWARQNRRSRRSS